MSRGQTDSFAPDLSALLAIALVFGLTFIIWRFTAHRDGAPLDARGDADAGVQVDSAELSPAKRQATAAAAPARTYNVILITVDTLRADLSFAGYPRPVTPNLDAFAAKNVVFENAYATASFTPKCLGPLHLGKYISETSRDYEHYTNFAPSNVFLAERVQSAGGRTLAAMCHRYFGWKKGLEQGFDVWDKSAIPPGATDNDPTPTSANLTDAAITLLSSPHANEIPVLRSGQAPIPARTGPGAGKFFAWFHYLDPHLPYVAHEGSPSFAAMPGSKERAPYDVEVWFTDKHIGRLLAHIAAQPWAKDTAIVFTADHGEAFGEHNHWGHGRELWQPLVHVPLIVSVPGNAARRVRAKRSHMDIVPTILELMGIAGDPQLRGKSLIPDLSSTSPPERDIYIDMPDGPYNERRRAVITGPAPGLKLIEFQGGRHELYDLAADPGEARNIVGDKARHAEANAVLSRFRSSVKEIPPLR